MSYVIQKSTYWINKKTGKKVENISYYCSINDLFIPFITLSNLDEAKKYKTKKDANADRKKYFGNSTNTKIIKL